MAGFDLLGLRIAAVPLARRNLFAERSQLLPSVSGIAFAIFLMLVQLGFQSAFNNSTLDVIRTFDADIVIISATKYQLSRKMPFSRRQLYEAKAVPGIASVRPLYAEWTASTWQNPKTGQRYLIQVFGFDPDQPVFLIPEVNAKLAELRQPDTVMMDARSRRFFGEARVGLESELSGKRFKIIGRFALGPDFHTDGTIIISDRNFEKVFPAPPTQTVSDGMLSERPSVEFGLVKVLPGHDVASVQRQLRYTLSKNVSVLTRQNFIDKEEAYQAQFSPVGPIFTVGVLIGFAVGMMIVYQILFSHIFDQLPQYATLKAMGYGNGYLVKVVLQQALIYGGIGYVLAIMMSVVLFDIIADIALLPMQLTPRIIFISLSLMLMMCIIAALFAVRRVLLADPAEVF